MLENEPLIITSGAAANIGSKNKFEISIGTSAGYVIHLEITE